MNDRISYATLTALSSARTDQRTRRALYAALMGINASEQAIRDTIRSLRAALDDAEARLDAGQHPSDSSLTARAATLDQAITAGRLHWQAAGALLADDEVATLTTPPAARRYPESAGSATRPLLDDGYTITWAPGPGPGCHLTLDKRTPATGHAVYGSTGASPQDAWAKVAAQLRAEQGQSS